nr:S8 family serine peptidase [Sporichthyaceae bacterium]
MTTMALGAQTVSRRAGLLLMAGALLLGVVPSLAPAGVALGETAQAAGAQLRSGAGSTATDKIDPAVLRVQRGPVDVIVSGAPGQSWQLRNAIKHSGGTVAGSLPMVSGFRATVPAHRLVDLAGSPAVTAVTKNRVMRFEEFSYDETTTASSFARVSGAPALWRDGKLGQGVGVAVLDTGVSPMNDFDGRLVHGPDLSGEGTIIDSYGHGTVMAGIVGGSGADSAGRTGGAYTGIAPKSTVVAVKVAGANGVTDVSTVLQGLHWVSAYKDQFNIRVVNLSWGVASTQSPTIDPLNYAVERLWQQGIVVVVAAGNAGAKLGTTLKPADDPMVISVGAFDDKQNVDPLDDSIPAWSSRGPTAAGLSKPDLVASGRTLVAARSFGSTVEKDNPKALISPSYIKGSGTSESAAVTSGAAALLL